MGKKEMERRIANLVSLYEDLGAMTLRGFYYQGVIRGYWPSGKRSWWRLKSTSKKARVEERLPLEAILDRSRPVYERATWEDAAAWGEWATEIFALDPWTDSAYDVQVWLEKDALSPVLGPLTRKYRVPLVIGRGDSSTALKRDRWGAFSKEKEAVLLYLGDLDPEGVEISRVYAEGQLVRYGAARLVLRDAFDLRRIALNEDQTEGLVPNEIDPEKERGPRMKAWERERGPEAPQYELDALPPARLRELLEDALRPLVDWDLQELEEREDALREDLRDRLGL